MSQEFVYVNDVWEHKATGHTFKVLAMKADASQPLAWLIQPLGAPSAYLIAHEALLANFRKRP